MSIIYLKPKKQCEKTDEEKCETILSILDKMKLEIDKVHAENKEKIAAN